jgi:hypothetical protein
MHQATIVHTFNGVESKTEVEDLDIAMFYAKIVGTVKGATLAGSAVTKIISETH